VSRALGMATYALISIVGLVAFVYPFWLPTLSESGHAQSAPFVTALLIGLCLIAVLLDAQANALNTKSIALLSVLIAINSVLRYLEVGIPGPGGFTPIFALVVLSGYIYGPRFGFLMGALTLLASALITGGVGPWLPYQMFTAGWVGLSAGWLGIVLPAERFAARRVTLLMLIVFGALWGFLYGAIMNLWFWPFGTGADSQRWQADLSLLETVRRYMAFYAATSFVFDAFGALGNAALIAVIGAPALRALLRFKQRFDFSWQLAGGGA
jgi:energy-coupling factor transport system substrate-specific component